MSPAPEPSGTREIHRCADCGHTSEDHETAWCGQGWCPDKCRLRPQEVKDQGHTETIPVFALQGAVWGP